MLVVTCAGSIKLWLSRAGYPCTAHMGSEAAFILCPPRLKMEVAGGKSKGEGRHNLLRSSLLSHRHW